MEIVPIDIFGINVDVPFLSPVGFHQARLEEFGVSLCDPAKGLNLRVDQMRTKRWDELFGYELSAHFFGENGTFSRTAERVKLGVRNARTAGDWKIMCDMFQRFYALMDFPETSVTSLSAHVHAKFASQEERDAWLGRFSYSPLISRSAVLGYVQIADWEKDIRVMIESSNVVPDGVFAMWDTQFVNEQDWESFLSSVPTMMENAGNLFDIGFEPLRERV